MMLSSKRMLVVALAAAATTHGQTTPAVAPTYDYTSQGTDWTDSAWTCLSTTSPTDRPVQSPTNIVPTPTPNINSRLTPQIDIGSPSGDYIVQQTLHTIRVTPSLTTPRSALDYDETYLLEYYDIRAPAEHLVDGKRAAMEIQLIFKSASKKFAGLSFLYDGIAEGEFQILEFARVLSEDAPTHFNTTVADFYSSTDWRYDVLGDAIELVQMGDALLTQYNGSSTYPPCAENYTWFVFPTIVRLPISSITPIADLLKYAGTLGNYRAVPAAAQAGITFTTRTKSEYRVGGAFGAGVSTVAALLVAMSVFYQL